jgi:hypothetical protein
VLHEALQSAQGDWPVYDPPWQPWTFVTDQQLKRQQK